MIYGITHSLDGNQVIRLPKAVKVGIGCPKGKGIHVYMDACPEAKATKLGIKPGATAWCVEYTQTSSWKELKSVWYANRAQVEEQYDKIRAAAAVVDYPRKLAYFTFLKPSVDGFVHDLEAIEQHGVRPCEIGILFTDNTPLDSKMAMWSATELRCAGDGVTAQRLVSIATADEAELVREAKEAGSKWYSPRTCLTEGCAYSQPTSRNGKEYPAACKPSGDLTFQLVANLRLGAKAYFHTTGIRSITQLSSGLAVIAQMTGGRVAGIPFKLVVLPFKTNHNGQPGTQYAVQLQVYESKEATNQLMRLLSQANDFQQQARIAPGGNQKLIAPPPDAGVDEEDDESPAVAAAMVAEYFPEVGQDDEPSAASPSEQAAAATQDKTEKLADKLADPVPSDKDAAREAGRVKGSALKERLSQRAAGAATPPPAEQAAAPIETPFD